MAKVPKFLLGGGAKARLPNQPATSKIGPVAGMTDRNVARGEPVTPKLGLGDNRTQVDTYFTKSSIGLTQTPIIYNGDRNWVDVTLTLETAGPVVVGTQSALLPVLSGRGALLTTNVPSVFRVAKGTRLYVQATGVNRIRRQIAPVPWLEQIVGIISEIAGTIVSLASGKKG